MFRLFNFGDKSKTPDVEFQDTLLRLLHELEDPTEIKRQLLSDPGLKKYKVYIEKMDLDMVDVGAQLIKKWGRFE